MNPLWPDVSSEELRLLLGSNIRAAREKAGLTQQELADAAGISRQHLSDLERGKRSGTTDIIHAIVEALDADWRKLLKPPAESKKNL